MESEVDRGSDVESIISGSNANDSDDEFYDDSVTSDDIMYEFSRQPYVPVLTGGANMLNELASSFTDHGSGLDKYIGREKSVQSGAVSGDILSMT